MCSRLLALEERLAVELYRKVRGRRMATPLTEQGHRGRWPSPERSEGWVSEANKTPS